MEEQVDKTGNDEEVKKEATEIARRNKDMDEETTSVSNNRIKSLEEVLQDPANVYLAVRIKNLGELGIKPERIKQLLIIKSCFSTGDTEEHLVDELDFVTATIIAEISEDKNGIVLNADGTINPKKSKIQQEEMAKENEKIYYLSEKTIDEVMGKVIEKITDNKLDKEFITKMPSLDFFYGKGLEDNDILKIIVEITEQERQWKEIYNNMSEDGKNDIDEVKKIGFFETVEESEIARALFQLKSDMNLRKGIPNNQKDSIEKFEKTIEKYFPGEKPLEVLNRYFEFKGEYNIDNLLELAEDIQHCKNEYDTFRELKQKLSFVKSEEDIDYDFVINIAKAFCHNDSEAIQSLIKEFGERLGKDLSSKEVVKELLSKYHDVKDVDNIEEYLNAIGKFCTDTNFTAYMDKVDEALANGVNSAEEVDMDKLVNIAKRITKIENRSFQENVIKELIVQRTDNFNPRNEFQNCLLVFNLYLSIDKNLKENEYIIDGIENFIKENAQTFTKNFGEDIFQTNKKDLNRTVLKNIIKATTFIEEEKLKKLSSDIKKSQEAYQNGREDNKELYEIIKKENISNEDQKKILDSFEKTKRKIYRIFITR